MGKKELNPADAYRREMKKKEMKKNKVRRDQVREVHSLLNNPDKIEEEIQKVRQESNENKLDKGLKERLKELEMMKSVALKKKMANDMMKGLYNPSADDDEPGAASRPSSSSSGRTGAPTAPGRGTPAPGRGAVAIGAAAQGRRPEDSVYYHPQWNPTGAPPPGQPMMYRPPSGAMAPGQRPLNAPQHVPPPPSLPGAGMMYPHMAPGMPPPPPPAMPPHMYQHMGQHPQAPPSYMGIPYAPAPRPPRPPVLIGGTNGVPLPPPLPGHGKLFLAQPPAEPKLTNAQKRRAAAMAIKEEDPLDPTGAGYLDRYGSKAAPPKGATSQYGAASHYAPTGMPQQQQPQQLGAFPSQATQLPPQYAPAGPPSAAPPAPAADFISQQYCVDASEYEQDGSNEQAPGASPAPAASSFEYEIDAEYYMNGADDQLDDGDDDSDDYSDDEEQDGDDGAVQNRSDEESNADQDSNPDCEQDEVLTREEDVVEAVPASSEPASRAPFFVPPSISAEDIMRRRFMLTSEEEAVPALPAPTAVPYVARDDDEDEDIGPSVGPSMPPMAPGYYYDLPGYNDNADEEEDGIVGPVGPAGAPPAHYVSRHHASNNSSVFVEDVSDEDEDDEFANSSAPSSANSTAPTKPVGPMLSPTSILNSASAASKRNDASAPPRALQSMFGGYGSGDEDDEEEEEEHNTHPLPALVPVPAHVHNFGTHSEYYGHPNIAVKYPTMYNDQPQHPSLHVSHTLPGEDRLGAPIPAPASISDLPLQSQGPKIVKVDAALKEFVPAALRKRTQGDVTGGPPKRPKPSVPPPTVIVPNSNPAPIVGQYPSFSSASSGPTLAASGGAASASQSSTVGSVSGSVNDAYDDFMKEISDLL